MSDLQQKADKFIQTAPYFEIIRAHGHLYSTGSYFLNTMTWPDIDMQLCLDKDRDAKETIAALASSFIKTKGIKKLQYIDFLSYPRPPMTEGHCLCMTAFDENFQNFWKNDLWILPFSEIQENQEFMNHLKEQMTPEHHALIMAFKYEWTTLYGRPPKMASYYLYQAVILENLQERQKIETYLRSKNVKI
ncbi:hypothetical protein IM40_04985 [Candidatus Paracaedimonas acanthamoebae]|nr:hypothetical protein IM40_04985 [Candidatus Paracaedimonas acanthamoebae]